MVGTFQFGIALRTQYPADSDISEKFQDLLELVRLADSLGYDSLTKTSHYSTAPYQAFQQFPLLARLSAEAPNIRLNAGIILLSLHKPCLAMLISFQVHPRCANAHNCLGPTMGRL